VLVEPSGGVGFEDAPNLVPDPAKHDQFVRVGSKGMSRIVNPPMMPVRLAWKHGASLIGISAHRDDRLDRLVEKLVQVFRAVLRDVDSDFLHHLDGKWMHVARRL
jgi:hypothetical protein